ncbi:type II toxin-antitoxin system HicB family antitoxin [Rhodococcus sp. WS4]|nr:type II toxin-antitoxin system HicB family antitoxin [Rhodococcus sp. WS4]
MADGSHYTYRVTWSELDSEFVGTVAEFPSLSWLAETQNEALDGIGTVVREVLGDMASTGERPPVPIADRSYSGTFTVRTSPWVHRALAVEAEEQGVSLNLLVNQKLSAPAGGRAGADTTAG